MKGLWGSLAGVLAMGSGLSAEPPLEERIRELELKSAPRVAVEVPGSRLGVAFKDGLHLRTTAGELDFRIGGHVIVHGTFHHHGEEYGVDTVTTKELQLVLHGRVLDQWYVHVAADLAPDAGGTLYEGWVEFDAWGIAKIRAGEFKVPYSLEALEPTQWQDFPENSLADLHAPARDLGVLVHSELFGGILDYSIGITNGNGPGGLDDNSDKDFSGYFGVSPLAWTGWDWLRRFRIGLGGTTGRHEGPADELPIQPMVPASGSEIQTDRAGKSAGFDTVREDGRRQRASADLALSIGPIDFNTQISRFKTGLRSTSGRSDYRSWANRWQLGFWVFGYRNTGERPTIEKPLFAGGPGGLQIVARYSTGTLDDDFIKRAGFAGTDHVREYSLAVNWYPNSHVRVSLMLSDIRYSRQGIPVGDPLPPAPGRGGSPVPGNDRFARHIDDEKVLILRVQVDF